VSSSVVLVRYDEILLRLIYTRSFPHVGGPRPDRHSARRRSLLVHRFWYRNRDVRLANDGRYFVRGVFGNWEFIRFRFVRFFGSCAVHLGADHERGECSEAADFGRGGGNYSGACACVGVIY
jgi:hypothetical protein